MTWTCFDYWFLFGILLTVYLFVSHFYIFSTLVLAIKLSPRPTAAEWFLSISFFKKNYSTLNEYIYVQNVCIKNLIFGAGPTIRSRRIAREIYPPDVEPESDGNQPQGKLQSQKKPQ